MNERIADIVDCLLSYLILIPIFYFIIWFGALQEKIKQIYYIIFRIPYYKGQGKFHLYIKRTDK